MTVKTVQQTRRYVKVTGDKNILQLKRVNATQKLSAYMQTSQPSEDRIHSRMTQFTLTNIYTRCQIKQHTTGNITGTLFHCST